jgi:hypothetical protein
MADQDMIGINIILAGKGVTLDLREGLSEGTIEAVLDLAEALKAGTIEAA